MTPDTTHTAGDPLLITTRSGAVRGDAENGVRTWRSIPFAAPPVGPLRLRAPQPAEPWQGVRDATAFGPVPPQRRGIEEVGAGKHTPISEDCLTLNVWAPETPSEEPVPVLVWFYGGAFTQGAASASGYTNGHVTRRTGAIFVTINYRVGALGFIDFTSFASPEHPFDSNVGLRDQVAGLEWVRDNIAAFGGDPGNVTIFGESAGGMSVIALMCIPAAHGLFHKAFAMSPAPSSMYEPTLHATWAGELVEALGVSREAAAEALATRPWEDLVAATETLTTKITPSTHPSTLASSPVVDGDFLPTHAIDAFRDGTAARVPLVIGTMANEGAFFDRILDVLPTTPSRIETMFSLTGADARDRVLAAYPSYPKKKAAIEVGGDVVFWLPSVQSAEAHSEHSPTWMYRLDFATPMMRLLGLGATHGMDMPAFFGNLGSGMGRIMTLLGGRRAYAAVGDRMLAAVASLARTGSPGRDWPQYDAERRVTRIIDREDRLESDPRGERRRAWGDFRGFL
ncbi:carboxylesterase/lipase family protein [Salinibacterium sp. SYSU T00001]|uniref:carboxylesterase/lipase family protein n=1 Tax=Homoserinimonas sedimenticola TaxID=2986805 RepID=UPI00223630A3|nr:carboxylesterase/lipase family protein [Salinibacterium sedimenticola]MCW4386224.1 carboxylesterase/lipase family protein [Salinibacterium sedimenticola]